MDPLSEVLRSVRLTGGVFLSADFTAPWSVSVRINSDDCAPFLARPAQMIGYHVIVEGRLLVALEGGHWSTLVLARLCCSLETTLIP
jgi:Cupin